MEVQRIGCLRDQPVEWRETLIRGDRFSVLAQWSAQEGYRMDVSGTEVLLGSRTGATGPVRNGRR
ncbi:MAG: hypothetical protein L0K86_27105, partial [Actinomycetia bacterium]|nr:hypothetical protein [Actinomycetes bacterium]